ncbi:uncharacterized protein RJT20DRAFT_115287 [Scheffersomyces xylosifermentans]|uniref:uncharacterized protein n=1 Tax=Scheffersomyces xylosifermentans TaxID=1304137 RepID=UPI00315C544F
MEARTLHERVLTNFNKTPSGKIYDRDIKDVYSILIICLKLTETAMPSKAKLNPLNKYYPFSFFLDRAIDVMQKLNISIELTLTTTTISYCIKPELAQALIKKFYEAKLIHSVTDRTRSEPKSNVPLSPTPKGVAILQSYCRRIGMKNANLPPILKSNFNSMDLHKFDRDPITDKILYSEYLLQLLFVKLIGDQPNIWSTSNKPDPLPPIEEKLEIEEAFGFNFEGANHTELKNITQDHFGGLTIVDTVRNKPAQYVVSPFYHRYFTNPESDAHVQYYVSRVGVRHLSKNFFKYDGVDVIVEHCMSGKAICQWLCDCTDVMGPRQAKELGSLLIRANLIEPVMFHQFAIAEEKFVAERDYFYVLTKSGRRICNWGKSMDAQELLIPDTPLENVALEKLIHTESDDSVFTDENSGVYTQENKSSNYILLKDILKDPGMRYLFKKHLEKEFCSENLDAYLQLKVYKKKINTLGKLLNHKKERPNEGGEKLDSQVNKLANVCLSLAYHIFFTYLSSDSPFILNIDYTLRAKITSIMVNHNYTKNMEPLESSNSEPGLNSMTSKSSNRENDEKKDIEKMEASLDNLVNITSIFQQISRHIYRLMEVDSYPKFLNSSIYRETLEMAHFSKV